MRIFQAPPRNGIKTESARIVKAVVLCLVLGSALRFVTLARAEDTASVPAPAATDQPAVIPNPTLPPIDARAYELKVEKRSSSGRVYLFDDLTPDLYTSTGSILLLKKDAEPVMAFRVIKTYRVSRQFAARVVKKYGVHDALDSGDTFSAFEKIGDLPNQGPRPAPTMVAQDPAIPPEVLEDFPPDAFADTSEQDKSDLKELEAPAVQAPVPSPEPSVEPSPEPPPPPDTSPEPASADPGPIPSAPPEVLPYDPELDAGTTPVGVDKLDQQGPKVQDADSDDDLDDSRFGQSVDEVYPLDNNNSWLSAEGAMIRNNAATGGSTYLAAAGIRYGLTLGRMLFVKKIHSQDSFAIEGGLFYYKILNYAQSGDAYTVMPLIGTARYNILLSDNLGIFFYGGIVKNLVTSAANTQGDDRTSQLSSILPAGGGGLIFRVGPSWEARLDAGIDMIGAGLMLRF